MSDDKEKAEELLQQSKEQTRHASEPSAGDEGMREQGPSLEEALLECYEALDDDEILETLTIRDDDLAVLLEALEQTGRIPRIGGDAHEVLERDDDVDSKAALLKALVRVGLREVSPETMEAAVEAKKEYVTSKEFTF